MEPNLEAKTTGDLVKSVTFTDNPKYYEIGDTITVNLSNGKKAIYELTKII